MTEKKILKSREEWLQNRRQYIGGSEASTILGMNPYMTNIDLWEIKTGRKEQEDISSKDCVQYGHDAEPLLRELFKLDHPEYEVQYEDNNSYTNDEYPWAAASLDGVLIEKDTGRKGILEIKTSNILQSMQRERWNDQIPQNYYIQILHYLMVTGYDFVVLRAALKSNYQGELRTQIRDYQIDRGDVEEDIRYLAEEEWTFWVHVANDTTPALTLDI